MFARRLLNMEIQTLDSENLDANGIINFAPVEMKYLRLELDRQFEEGNGIDFLKAIRNARYFAEIERSLKQLEEGRGQFHELIEV